MLYSSLNIGDLNHVLFIADPVTSGGATECMVDLISRLQTMGVQCTVCLANESDLAVRIRGLGARPIITGHERFLFAPPAFKPKIPLDYAQSLKRYLSSRKTAIDAAEESIDFETVDLIHTNTPRMDLGVELASRYGIPHICHLRELSFSHFGCKSFRANPAQYISDGSLCLIAISEAVKKEWVDAGASADKIKVVYDGVDVEHLLRYSTIETQDEGLRTPFRIVFPGGCSGLKGIWDAILAVELISKARPVSLDVYGWDSRSTLHEVLAYTRLRSISEYVNIFDRTPKLAERFAEYDCGLICSKAEGFGMAAIEMQAAGLPVIAADTGAMPELIADGRNGLLYSKRIGARDLAMRITQVMENGALCKSLRSGGMKACRDYSSEKCAQSIFELYEQVMKTARRQEL